MMIIPQPLPILPDESLYSYIIRLADHNVLDIPLFVESYVWPNSSFNSQKTLRYDSMEDIHSFIDSINYLGQPLDIIRNHTIYPAVAPFINSMRQDQILNVLFGQNKQYSNIIGNVSSFLSSLKLCKKCVEEDLKKYGCYYYHRKHQLPNVCACYKHKIPLIEYKPQKRLGYKHSLDLFSKVKENINTNDIEYSKFISELFELLIDSSESITTSLIVKKVRSDYYDSGLILDSYQCLIDDLEKRGYYQLSANHDLINDIREIVDKGRGSLDARMMLICACYNGSAKDFANDIKQDVRLYDEFMRKHPRYTMLSEYNSTGITLKHDECGSVFHITPQGFLYGWKCPHCNYKSEKKQFEALFRKITDGKYIIKSEFINKRTLITLKHKDCNESYKTKVIDFLYRGCRCKCETQYTEKKIKSKLRKEGFELIEYNGYTLPATILHIDKHHSFGVTSIKAFCRTPFCHICEQERLLKIDAELSKEHFVNEIKALVGEEYQLVSKYVNAHTNVDVLHDRNHAGCGKVFSIRPDSFVTGTRCTVCRKNLPFSDFIEYVKRKSEGKYSVEEAEGHNMYKITNHINNKSAVLKKTLILQELRRIDHNSSLRLP